MSLNKPLEFFKELLNLKYDDLSMNDQLYSGIEMHHHSNSKYHIDSIKHSILFRLRNNYESMKEMIEENHGNDVIENTIVKILNMDITSITCPYCGKRINCYTEDGILKSDDEDECFEYKPIEIKIKTKSGKFVIGNDLREHLKTEDYLSKSKVSINHLMATIDVTKNFAKDNIICGFVGNTGISSYRKGQDFIFSGGFNSDYDLSVCDHVPGRISCDLWWFFGVDEVDLKKSYKKYKNKYVLDLEPDTEYMLRYDPNNLIRDEEYVYELNKIL